MFKILFIRVGETIIIEPTDLTSTIVRSMHETFNWNINEGNYCQIIILKSKSNIKVIDDAILWFDYLLNLVTDGRHDQNFDTEISCEVKQSLIFF